MMCMHAPIMAGRFGANKASNGSVTSTVISWVTSKEETHKSASHLGHKKSKKVRNACEQFPPEKNEKKQQINTHASHMSTNLGHATMMMKASFSS